MIIYSRTTLVLYSVLLSTFTSLQLLVSPTAEITLQTKVVIL